MPRPRRASLPPGKPSSLHNSEFDGAEDDVLDGGGSAREDFGTQTTVATFVPPTSSIVLEVEFDHAEASEVAPAHSSRRLPLPKSVSELRTDIDGFLQTTLQECIYDPVYTPPSFAEVDANVEYDLDEDDEAFLYALNEQRAEDGLLAVTFDEFEYMMDRLEKECFYAVKQRELLQGGLAASQDDAPCAVCGGADSAAANALMYCDGCNLPVHQECYGVPYIPEGPWLCRRCLLIPEAEEIFCSLCGRRGGAFKRTSDLAWAHVLCALFITEVGFSNEVFLEPIESARRADQQRWRLTCSICHTSRRGACVQCAKASCYAAYHASCARQAGLKVIANTPPKRSVSFCARHSTDSDLDGPTVDFDSESYVTRRKSSGYGLYDGEVEDGHAGDDHKPLFDTVFDRVRAMLRKRFSSLRESSAVLSAVASHWREKRHARNNTPLLKRLHIESSSQLPSVPTTREEAEDKLRTLRDLRDNVIKGRELAALTIQREKLKATKLRLSFACAIERCSPLLSSFVRTILSLRLVDREGYFEVPVDVAEVPDYLSVIARPMDFGTLMSRVESAEIITLEQFWDNCKLIWENAMIYNKMDTIYYKAAQRIKNAAEESYEKLIEADAKVDEQRSPHRARRGRPPKSAPPAPKQPVSTPQSSSIPMQVYDKLPAISLTQVREGERVFVSWTDGHAYAATVWGILQDSRTHITVLWTDLMRRETVRTTLVRRADDAIIADALAAAAAEEKLLAKSSGSPRKRPAESSASSPRKRTAASSASDDEEEDKQDEEEEDDYGEFAVDDVAWVPYLHFKEFPAVVSSSRDAPAFARKARPKARRGQELVLVRFLDGDTAAAATDPALWGWVRQQDARSMALINDTDEESQEQEAKQVFSAITPKSQRLRVKKAYERALALLKE